MFYILYFAWLLPYSPVRGATGHA